MVGLSIALTLSFLTSVAGTVASIIVFKREPTSLPSSIQLCSLTALLLAEVKYDPILNICYLAKSATPFIVLWAIPVGGPYQMLAFCPFQI